MSKESHLERTAKEPRDSTLHPVIVKRIDQINDSIRVFRLAIPNKGTIEFLPGQWLDVYVPTVSKAGGFTITSSPSKAVPKGDDAGYIELAIQKSPDNPPAIWLWQPEADVLGAELNVRVGGSFVWPPAGITVPSLRRVVFAAGGVGINPLMSMLSALGEEPEESLPDLEVHMLYSMKDPGGERLADEILFLERIATIFAREKVQGSLKLFLTGGIEAGTGDSSQDIVSCNEVDVPFLRRRIATSDIAEAIGEHRTAAVVYVCGVPTMTDRFIAELSAPGSLGLDTSRVLYEKWW
ncbi:hypothetical protein GQ53DRAFT_816262 [Thozetella sp. PMI_491]|nr:hypothetical protein GQ53DRAFT_816262 [Thozetella sp. PMI_491]